MADSDPRARQSGVDQAAETDTEHRHGCSGSAAHDRAFLVRWTSAISAPGVTVRTAAMAEKKPVRVHKQPRRAA